MSKRSIYTLFYKLGAAAASDGITDAEGLLNRLTMLNSQMTQDSSGPEEPIILDTTGERHSSATWGDKIELFTEGNTGVNVR